MCTNRTKLLGSESLVGPRRENKDGFYTSCIRVRAARRRGEYGRI